MSVIIIGTGNWGSTLAGLINPQQQVRMWCENDDWARRTQARLKEVAGATGGNVSVEIAFEKKFSPDDIVLLVIPSSVVAVVARQIRDHVGDGKYPTIVTASKGLDRETFRTMSQVIADEIPGATVAVLSGPNIAREIANGRPAKAMIGCDNVNHLIRLAKALRSDRFHLEMTRETVDLELCAAMKGVFAIGSGVIAGRELGSNFMGLLLTYGMREIEAISRFLGISNRHVYGIAGLGDLVATCFSPDSRNYRLGELLARGASLQEALDEVQMVVEGAMTASAVSEMAALRLPLPLFAAIARIVEAPSAEALDHFEQILLNYPGQA